MRGGEFARRGWLVAFFALLATFCIAAPVLAEAPVEGGEASDPLELQRVESLETPQAEAAREDSEYAYAELTAGQEADLLQNLFAPQLEAIDADPARALAEVTIERLDSPTEALVTLDGEKALLESEVPLRAPEEDGDLHKVELGLEATPAGFEPANPLVELTLPGSAQAPIVIGEEGLAITPVGTAATAAEPIGEEDLLLPAAHEDTSFLLSPIAGGLELSAMLASRNSPQELGFDVTLPQGASLRAVESGGAEVVGAGGEQIATITAPRAVDAQGTEVPAALAVEGNALSILVPHQELDVAYPLFVDPEIVENWSGFADASKLGYWHWAWGGVAGAEDYIGSTACIVTCWGNGLYVRARSGFSYPAGSWGRWWFTPQGSTTYMRRVILGPVRYDAHGCTANQPHGYIGVWNDYSGWVVRNNAFPSGWATSVDVGNLPPGSRTAFVGIHADSGSKLNCGRDYQLGGASLYLDDPEQPSASATSGYPTGWVKSGTSFTVSGPGSDPGLGLKKATLYPAQAVTQTKELGCDGHYSNPCPNNYTFQFSTGAGSFDEGEKTVEFKVEDALGKPSNTHTWTMKIDRTPPEIELAGQLAQATDETEGDGKDDKDKPLPLPVYNLTVNATDGVLNPANGGQKRSGVKKIQVFIDNRSTPEQTWEAGSCSAGNCPLSKVFTLKLNELSADTEHYLRVLATDFAGNAPRERKLEFEYIPATGMKDEYVMQYFPLPDGSGNEAEEEHPSRPELAVNLVSGNLVYRQEDLDISGAAADLELELFYNSLLPEQQNTEWGDGWTLAQTPELEIEDPGAGAPSEATIIDESAMVESKVDLPAGVGEEEFDKRLQATVEKEAGGGYSLTDEGGETGETVYFDSSGKAEELTNGTAATVEYDYEGGDLSAITIEDPGTANVDPESIEEEESPRFETVHAANFGSAGSADGQMSGPADVALSPTGDLWVLDSGNARIQRFGPDGQFISKFAIPEGSTGFLTKAKGLAVDAAGNLLVTERHRVQKISPSGQSLLKFGASDSPQGPLVYPAGVTVGADGSIWVADSFLVQRFTPEGQFIEVVATNGTGAGQVRIPRDLATAPNGDVVVVDSNNHRIAVFDEDGDFVRQFGSSGSGPGQFNTPAGVDVDSEGNIWVTQATNDRVQVFTSAGEYISGFGSAGSGAEQFAFESSAGLVVGEGGLVFAADPGNNRIDRWLASRVSDYLHSANFGSAGSADGQMSGPADVALSPTGDLWVLDSGNGRIQRFGPDGQFISKFAIPEGSTGFLTKAKGLAVDAAGNLLVTEQQRVQKLSPSGQSLAKFGSFGSQLGQLQYPSGIAVGADGSIWVGDASRVQRFTPEGQPIEVVATGGSGAGQVNQPRGIAVAPDGDVAVVEAGSNRVSVFDEDGDFLRHVGSSGSGPGQFTSPSGVDIDPEGNIWVSQASNDRVQVFSPAGDYIGGFGSAGSGAQQFAFEASAGLAVGEGGLVWAADTGNNRIDEWLGGYYEPSSEPVLTEDDPQLEVEVSEGLVDSVEGEESGTIDYDHDGDLLTAVAGDDGEAQFSYDSAGRMTKVSLPNGTYGEIAYEATYGRVKTVTVAVEGKNPKTTYFAWSDEPHRTTVTPPDAPATTYDIAADGSIFKWWNAKQPPVLDDVAGTLYDNRETSSPIATGIHNLVIQAHDDEGVASIQVIANNNQLVDERTCAYDPEAPTECVTETNEWVTETGNWPPGIVYLEVIATDRLGEASSQRFWVNIPYTPPPDPEAEEPPRFSDVLRFREDRGLDLDLKNDELAINDRVFESIGAWHNPLTPAGEVARATYERWGVPLRAVDAAELDYRQAYSSQAVTAIPNWASAHAGSSYAGYFIDERAGGLLRVGFTGGESSQTSQVEALKQSGGLIEPDRVRGFSSPPSHSLAALATLQGQIADTRTSAPNLITSVSIDLKANRVSVGATDVGQAEDLLDSTLGESAPADVSYQPPMPRRSGREQAEGPMRAGDWMQLNDRPSGLQFYPCTANFGAFATVKSPQTGELIKAMFVLGAGHCLELGYEVLRRSNPSGTQKDWIGSVRREGNDGKAGTIDVDAAAVRLKDPGVVPRKIFIKENLTRPPVVGIAEAPEVGTEVCYSGVKSNRKRCGPIIDDPHEELEPGGTGTTIMVCFEEYIKGGDSGSPVWLYGDNGDAWAVGIANAGFDEAEAAEFGVPPRTCFEPLLPFPGWGPRTGLLTHPAMAPLQLAKAP
jgi:streptogramin lyase